MAVKLHKYSGAGNDFILADLRVRKPCSLCCAWTLADEAEADSLRTPERIKSLCSRTDGFVAPDGSIGADGVILLSESGNFDFRMEFFNPDGSSGMMCGNGGRCIVAFAADCGISPASEDGEYVFEAPDGIHTARILSADGRIRIVRLKMADACEFRVLPALDGYFLDTGTRHFVRFVHSVEAVAALDVAAEGRKLRWDEEFAPQGTNVNFVAIGEDDVLAVRTFEKGVEAETLACGTGVTAAAVASYHRACLCLSGQQNTAVVSPGVHYDVQTRGGLLQVDFKPVSSPATTVAADVYLTGPAELVGNAWRTNA